MSTSKKGILAIALILFCSASIQAQETEDVIKIDTNLVTINVSVKGNKGRLLPGLRREDFLVIEEGNQMQVEFFDNYGPASIVFVVDLSSSMQGKKWKNLKAGMKEFLASAHTGNDYTLIGFSDRPSIIASSANEDELWQVINTLVPAGNTALYDAMLLGLNVLADIPRRHKALILFSDGEDNFSRSVLTEVREECLTRRATIYTVGILNDYYLPFSNGRTGKELLKELANVTGGLAHFPKAYEIKEVLKEIKADLASQYTLSYYPLQKSPGRRRVQVSMTQTYQSLKLRYQQYYTVR
ncbi:MAG TPA: VWA domain-containing protein [Pyrinomonadaceae bacterium]